MSNPKDILSPSDLRSYLNVKMAATIFILIGVLQTVSTSFVIYVALTSSNIDRSKDPIVLPAAIVICVLGTCAIVSGVAISSGMRQLAPFIYGVAVFYLVFVPLGTILSIIIFMSLSGYFRSLEQIKAARL